MHGQDVLAASNEVQVVDVLSDQQKLVIVVCFEFC